MNFHKQHQNDEQTATLRTAHRDGIQHAVIRYQMMEICIREDRRKRQKELEFVPRDAILFCHVSRATDKSSHAHIVINSCRSACTSSIESVFAQNKAAGAGGKASALCLFLLPLLYLSLYLDI